MRSPMRGIKILLVVLIGLCLTVACSLLIHVEPMASEGSSAAGEASGPLLDLPSLAAASLPTIPQEDKQTTDSTDDTDESYVPSVRPEAAERVSAAPARLLISAGFAPSPDAPEMAVEDLSAALRSVEEALQLEQVSSAKAASEETSSDERAEEEVSETTSPEESSDKEASSDDSREEESEETSYEAESSEESSEDSEEASSQENSEESGEASSEESSEASEGEASQENSEDSEEASSQENSETSEGESSQESSEASEEASSQESSEASEGEASQESSEESDAESSGEVPWGNRGVTPGDRVTNGYTDQEYLAAICQIEAGGTYEGSLAVANCVLNRLYDGRFGSSIYHVIYAPYQFATGNMDYWLEHGPGENARRGAADALAGINNLGGYLYFNGVYWLDPDSLTVPHVVIGGNCFY